MIEWFRSFFAFGAFDIVYTAFWRALAHHDHDDLYNTVKYRSRSSGTGKRLKEDYE